jgi:hypothetical protein
VLGQGAARRLDQRGRLLALLALQRVLHTT